MSKIARHFPGTLIRGSTSLTPASPIVRSRTYIHSVPLSAAATGRKSRKEGDIGSVFASLSGEAETALPHRYAELKQTVIGDADNQARLTASFRSLTQRLRLLAPEIEKRQQECVPTVTFEELVEKPPGGLTNSIKQCGTVIVQGVVDREMVRDFLDRGFKALMAEQWLEDIRAYIKLNPSVKGFPANDKQVFELYWSKSQLAARSHPRVLAVQRALLKLFSAPPGCPVSLETPLTYADRLRIRYPGDAQFALGPHMDGGSVERWEDEGYRAVYDEILSGNWEKYDAWQMKHRAEANQNMYDGAGSCGVFRAFQGWTSLSSTGPTEGTLRVYPYLREQTAYTLLRPLFRELHSRATLTHEDYLAADNWVLDTESTRFPGSPPARGQELNDETHPHLELDRSMVSIPRVEPGDQAWWHCDVVHAVESVHRGTGPSAVMYIPTVPLTTINAQYVRDQRESFLQAIPPPDFPGGVGEKDFQGTGRAGDIQSLIARSSMGLACFEISDGISAGEADVRQRANEIFGF